jgi:hypothetical protein
MSNNVVFIVADEKLNAGERDYMKALANVINSFKRQDTIYHIRKIGEPTGQEDATYGSVLPTNDADYAKVPRLTNEKFDGPVKLIAVGHSTFDALCTATDHLDDTIGQCDGLAWITHMIEDRHRDFLYAEGVDVFSPSETETTVYHHKLDAVPHTNSPSSCAIDYALFQEDARFQEFNELVGQDAPFAFAVLNAGFPVAKENGTEWHPYKEYEARRHGYDLGSRMAAGTALLLVDGGPRNLKDETEFGQNNMSVFVDGYLRAQHAIHDVTPGVFTERFVQGAPYNVIKAGFVLCTKENCLAFVSNSEGYGTMDGAVLYADNQKGQLLMYSFEAQYEDITGQRAQNIEKYKDLGVSVIDVRGELHASPEKAITPIQQRDAAVDIVHALRLAEPKVPSLGAKPEPFISLKVV